MGVNYTNTFIAVAEDCPAGAGIAPPRDEDKPTIAAEQYRLLSERPYELTSEDVIFEIHANRQGIPETERPAAREEYFSKGRACLRTSPLAKTYGWGLHNDGEGRLALVGVETDEYRRLASGEGGVKVVRAMRSRRK